MSLSHEEVFYTGCGCVTLPLTDAAEWRMELSTTHLCGVEYQGIYIRPLCRV